MSERTELLEAAQRAGRLTIEHGFKRRVQSDGFTRVDPFALAEAVELAVMVRPLPKLLGAFLMEDGNPGIMVNSDRPIGMVHLTCAHELGHYFLGHDPHIDEDVDHSDNKSMSERAANEFAYQLLMPRWLVKNIMHRKHWGVTSLVDPVVVYQLSLRLGVSFTAMIWSLKSYGLVSYGQALQLKKSRPIDIKSALIPDDVVLQEKADVWVLDPRDQESILEPRAGDRFVLRLPSNAGAGYVWSSQEAADAGFTIRPVLLDPETTPKPKGPVLPGSPPSMSYIAEPSESASASDEIVPWSLVERQPWDNTAAPAATVEMRTQFDGLLDGLTPGARRRHLDGMAAA